MDASPEEIASLANHLAELANSLRSASDPMSRKLQTSELVLEAKKMIWRIQDPFEALMDHVVNGYTVSAALALLDMGVFEAVPLKGTATVQEIARQCDTEEELITRLMRQLTCVNIFKEVGLGEWAHSRLSVGLSEHIGMNGKYFFKVAMEEMLPSMLTLGQYTRQFGRRSLLHTYTNTPHSWYNNMQGKNFWEVLCSDPERINQFSRGLSMFEALHPVVAIFPFEAALTPGNSADRPLAVDIGGGRGLAMMELRKGCPSLKGELILQDQPVVLNEIAVNDLPGITKMPHDFFQEQPVKNAQMYYIRRVMHDWQDADAARILKAIVPAMAKDSRIIISDMALPEPVTVRDAGAIWMDLMMLTIGGKERTKGDWAKLAELSGLKLVKVWQDPLKFGPLCVVEYKLPGAEEDLIDGQSDASTPKLVPTTETNGDVDWEERTVVGDREQSLEPSIHG